MQARVRIPCILLVCCIFSPWGTPISRGDDAAAAGATLNVEAASASADTSGDELLARAVIAIEQQPSIAAKLRQQIDLFEQQLVGSGTYLQGPANQHQFRLELRLQGAEQGTTLQHVSDGATLWIFRELDGKDGRVSKVQLPPVLEALKRAGQGGANSLPGLGLGGLPKLLAALARDFHFAPPEAANLGSLPVVLLRGDWRPSRLATLLPEQKEAIEKGAAANLSKLAPHVPEQVVLTLGRDDLFPYRLQFLRRAPAGILNRSKDELRPIVTLEVFEVKLGAPLDRAPFIYQPDPKVTIPDDTDHYLRALGF
ncbi:MAG: hypothetical protein KF708_20975 [Pirellulales bacterium]|nr:hypothetical protein [Pirellulales bacterium]